MVPKSRQNLNATPFDLTWQIAITLVKEAGKINFSNL
jgi:hypothetical protein